MSESPLLISDLDGTLLGDDLALERFRQWRATTGRNWRLIYSTGRTCQDVRGLIAQGELPEPTVICGSLGTQWYHVPTDRTGLARLSSGAGSWQVEKVRAIVDRLAACELQPDEFQSPLKASYFYPRADDAALSLIRSELNQAGCAFEMIYSGDRFLDFLPAGIHKGSAAMEWVSRWRIPHRQVIVCGDSGNDLALLQQGFCGVLVNNAEPAINAAAPPSVYRAAQAFADGALEGIRYWMASQRQPLTSTAGDSTRGDRPRQAPSASHGRPE